MPGLKPRISPGGDQVIIRHQNDIYELSLDNTALKAELIFENLKILDNVIATSFLHDKKNQRLFIATVTSGFIIVTKRLFKTLTFNSPNALDNAINAFLLLPKNKILTQKGILSTSNGNDDLLFKEEVRPDGDCFYRARDKTIRVSKDKRLHVYDSNFSTELAVDSLALDSYISCIMEDGRHTVWVTTLTSLLKIADGKLQYVFKRHPAFVKHNIESIVEVSPTEFWIASRDGIYVYDIARDSIGENPILPHIYARNFYRAKDNSLWISTYGNGYYTYHQGKFIALPADAHNYLSTAHTFLEDELGFFWITTNHGLFRIRKKELDDFATGRNKACIIIISINHPGLTPTNSMGGAIRRRRRTMKGIFISRP